MRLSVILLIAAALGVIAGAWLAGGLPAVGGAIIFDSLAAAAWALFRDDGQPQAQPEAPAAPTVEQIFDRARRVP